MPMSPNIISQIKSLLTGMPVEADDKPEPKRNPYPNGPATYKTMTNGQVRRMEARTRKASQRKAFRGQRKAYLNREAERAVLRSMLQVLGYIPFVTEQKAGKDRNARAMKWIADNYETLDNALKRYEALSGEKITA